MVLPRAVTGLTADAVESGPVLGSLWSREEKGVRNGRADGAEEVPADGATPTVDDPAGQLVEPEERVVPLAPEAAASDPFAGAAVAVMLGGYGLAPRSDAERRTRRKLSR
jgi:hypothetical protein